MIGYITPLSLIADIQSSQYSDNAIHIYGMKLFIVIRDLNDTGTFDHSIVE